MLNHRQRSSICSIYYTLYTLGCKTKALEFNVVACNHEPNVTTRCHLTTRILNFLRTIQTQAGLVVTAYLGRSHYSNEPIPDPDSFRQLRLCLHRLCRPGTIRSRRIRGTYLCFAEDLQLGTTYYCVSPQQVRSHVLAGKSPVVGG